MEGMIEMSKQSAVRGMERFLKTFEAVPDDKVNWSPSPSAKTPLQIAAHAACTAGNFAVLFREGRFPAMDIGQFMAHMKETESRVTTREQAVALFRANTDAAIAALEAITPGSLAATIDTPFGFSAPMSQFTMVPGMHAQAHAAQIDYLQTCWGDQEMHF
ncbi:MAG TPA: DinB family protein [Chthonomonadaceae bacterium]|nr:DinB family protein [Chthonomonadaceae bacterium]